jgi:hypothetical protein
MSSHSRARRGGPTSSLARGVLLAPQSLVHVPQNG